MIVRLVARGLAILTVVLGIVLGAAACRPDDQRTDTVDPRGGITAREDMAPEVLAQLDSGTAAFRADDHERALAHYTRVTELAPELGQGWFGVAMAAEVLGDTAAVAAAMERARNVVPGATLLDPDEEGAR